MLLKGKQQAGELRVLGEPENRPIDVMGREIDLLHSSPIRYFDGKGYDRDRGKEIDGRQ